MSKTFDLSTLNLSAGTHEITVKARASGYADSSASNAVSYVVEEEDTVAVSGTWYFNNTLNLPETAMTREDVKFTSYYKSSGIEYTAFTAITVSYASLMFTYYKGLSLNISKVFKSSGGWTYSATRTITFDGVQTVSKEFYEWLVDNAVQQT